MSTPIHTLLSGASSSSKFGDLFLMPSADQFPKDLKSSFDLSLFLYGLNRLYGAVINRIVTYFITDIACDQGTPEDQKKLKELLVKTIRVFAKMQQAGTEWGIYGNAFVRCVEPFDRWLVDSRNGRYVAISLSWLP